MNIHSNKKNIPADGWAGLKENFTKDALSGFLVFLLALPLSLGIAKASDFPAIFGIITAIIGGVVVSFFAGSKLTIKGPAAGLIVIGSGAVTAFGGGVVGWQMALSAIVVAGFIQVLFGVFKLGKLADFFPTAAIHGMLAAIGIIIISKQVHTLLGIDPALLKGKEPLELLAMIPSSIMHENAHIAEIGIACLILMIAFSFIKHQKIKKIPAPLVVLAIAIPLGQALHIKTEGTIASFALVKIGSITEAFKNGIINADFSVITKQPGVFIEYVILFALIGSIESLLTAKAIDHMDPYKRKSDFNQDLVAVGAGNILSGLLGGVPMISEVARSSANVNNGAKTRWANFFHGLFLLLAVVFAAGFIEMIPNAALAAMLIFVGFKLAHPKEFQHMLHLGKQQLAVFITTILVTISTDLLIGVGSGIILEMIFNLINGASFKEMMKPNHIVHKNNDNEITLSVHDALVFSNILGFKKTFSDLPKGKKLTVDVSKAKIVDHTSIVTLNSLADDYRENNGDVIIEGFHNHTQLGHAPTSARILKN